MTLEKDFIEYWQQIGRMSGLDSISSTIIGTLFLEDDLSLDELAEKTGYSLSSISNKIKFLETIGIIQRFKKPGSKKVYAKIEKDMFKMFKEILLKKQMNQMSFAKSQLPKIIENNKTNKKIKTIKNYYKQMLKMDEVMQHMLANLK